MKLTLKERRKRFWSRLHKHVAVRCDCGLYIMVNPDNPCKELEEHFKECEKLKKNG